MKIVVHDACALIDLLTADLVEPWLKAGIEIHTTQLVMLEVTDGAMVLTGTGVMHIHELTALQLTSLLTFKTPYSALSLEDCSVLRLAKDLGAPLLTGDKDLRRTAEKEGVEVHGMLWVLDQLVELSLISAQASGNALKSLIGKGSRFPREEVERRLQRWSPEV